MSNYHYYGEKMHQKDVTELLAMLESGAVTSEELVWGYLEHIGAQDKAGAKLNAIREFNPDAMAVARQRDEQRRRGQIMGPLHGVPVVLKDCIDTADKMHTTCGAVALKDHYAKEDAFIVKKLREAGAIIMAKTNMSEWYGYISTKVSSGYSGIAGGSMKNPFDGEKFRPGGSSGGSAVAVSADLTAAAIGTETAGSITEPAYFNGIVGFKPTVGLVSRTGILPVMFCQDAAGPMTRSVRDAALLTNVLVAYDEADPDTWRAQELAGVDFTAGLEEETLAGKRVGVAREFYFDQLDDEAKAVFETAMDALRAAGAEVVDIPDFMPAKLHTEPEKYPFRLTGDVMNGSFRVRLDHYLSQLGDDVPVHSFKELLDWNEAHPEAIPFTQDYMYVVYEIEDPVMSNRFTEARWTDLYVCGTHGIDGALQNMQLDAVIMPGVSGQGIAPKTGNPIINIPIGYAQCSGPVGMALIGSNMGDAALLCLARACEKVLPQRPIPAV